MSASDAGRERESSTVHLTRIYTKTGDDGTTALGDMSRTAKTDARVTAYGDVDEANSTIGVAIALGGLEPDVVSLLTGIQSDLLFILSRHANLATGDVKWKPRGTTSS